MSAWYTQAVVICINIVYANQTYSNRSQIAYIHMYIQSTMNVSQFKVRLC